MEHSLTCPLRVVTRPFTLQLSGILHKKVAGLSLTEARSYPKIVAYLLDYGADVNCRGSNGLCPIHIAAKCGNEALLRVLLERGARTDRYIHLVLRYLNIQLGTRIQGIHSMHST